jgi:general secretion pathway protein G
MLRNKKGFTLIELLVVISLIAVLSILFVNTATINLKRGRDARRKGDLELIRSGVETYRADCNTYPLSITFGSSLRGTGNPVNCAAANTYISVIPQDPQSSIQTSYRYWSNGTTYEICSALETGSGSATCGGSSACGSATCNYQVTNP